MAVKTKAQLQKQYTRKNEKVSAFSVGKVAGSDRDVYAQWRHSKSAQASGYDYDWEYAVGGKWFPGSKGNVDIPTASVGGGVFRNVYTAPDNAYLVRCRIRPVSKDRNVYAGTETSGSGKNIKKTKKYEEVPYFSGTWVVSKSHDFRLDKLPTPTVTADLQENGQTVKVTVECDDADCAYCDVQALLGNKVKQQKVNARCVGSATFSFTVKLGETWKFRARVDTAKKGFAKGTSNWSGYVTAKAKPPKPTSPSVKAVGSDGTSAKMTWKAAASASTYTAEYVADGNYFKSNPTAVRSADGIVGTTFQPTDLEPGHRWYFRVKAVNSSGESAWSNVVNCVLATVPDAPTTYDTDPSYITDEKVRFRWTHNCEDESDQTAYQIFLDIYDDDGTGLVKTAWDIPYNKNTGTFALPSDFTHPADVQYERPTGGGSAHKCGKYITIIGTGSSRYVTSSFPYDTEDYITFDNSTNTATISGHAKEMVDGVMYNTTVKLESITYYSDHTTKTLSGNGNEFLDYALSGFTDGALVKWKVRTKGAHASWSPWSARRSFRVYTRPTLSVVASQTDAEGEQVDRENPLVAFPLAVTLDAAGGGDEVAAYHVSIVAAEELEYLDEYGYERTMAAGEVAFEADYTDVADPYTAIIGAGDAIIRDTGVYQVNADVAMKSGLRATADPWVFQCDFDEVVPAPNASVTFDDELLVANVFPACYAVDEDGTVTEELQEGVTLSVYRIDDDGTLVLLQSGIENTGDVVVVDPHAQFGTCWYHVVATDTDTGLTNFADAYAPSPHNTCVIQWDEDWQQAIDADDMGDGYSYSGLRIDGLYNLQFDESGEVEAEDVEYIGRQHPVSYYGTQKGYTARYQMEFPKYDYDTLDLCRRLMGTLDDCYIREPSGTGFWAHAKLSLSRSYDNQAITLNVEATRVDRDDSALTLEEDEG